MIAFCRSPIEHILCRDRADYERTLAWFCEVRYRDTEDVLGLAIIAAAFNINIGSLLIVLSLLLTVVFILPLLYFKLWFRNVILTTLIIFSTSLNVFYFPNDEVSKLFHKEHHEQMLINP